MSLFCVYPVFRCSDIEEKALPKAGDSEKR